MFMVGCNTTQASQNKLEDINVETATQYVKDNGCRIIEVNGKESEYILDKEKLMNWPYSSWWELQTDVDSYIGKKIETYGFIIENNRTTYNDKNRNALVMICEGKVCGGYACPIDTGKIGMGYTTLDGKTVKDLTGRSYSEQGKYWREKYK